MNPKPSTDLIVIIAVLGLLFLAAYALFMWLGVAGMP